MLPWGITSVCGFVCLHHQSVTSSSKLYTKNYSAEWIDLQSKDSYAASPSIPLPNNIEPSRSGAVSVSTKNDKLITFGGYAEVVSEAKDTPPERFVVNDLWKFIPYQETQNTWGWTKIEQDCDEYIPGPRLASAMAFLPSTNQAVLLGGWDPKTQGTGGIILDDVSMLDLDSFKWSPAITDFAAENNEVTIPGGPTSRHVAVSISDSAICLHNHRCNDHVLLFSVTEGEGEFNIQPTTGDSPSSRGLHCAATLPKSTNDNSARAMVIFGGAAQDGNMSNESFVLDVSTWEWIKLDVGNDKDNIPCPRAGACLCSLDDDSSLLLFGGATPGEAGLLGLNDVWILNIDMDKKTGKWECSIQDTVTDDDGGVVRPPQRNAATLSSISTTLLPNDVTRKEKDDENDDDASYFILQGGWYPFKTTYNDNYLLKVSSTK